MANESSINLWTLSVNNIRSEDISAIAIPNVNGAVTPEKLDRAYAQLSGDTFTGSITVSKNNKSITFDGEKIYRQDGSASSKSYLFPSTPGTLATTQLVNAALQDYLPLSGGTISGDLKTQVNKFYFDTVDASMILSDLHDNSLYFLALPFIGDFVMEYFTEYPNKSSLLLDGIESDGIIDYANMSSIVENFRGRHLDIDITDCEINEINDGYFSIWTHCEFTLNPHNLRSDIATFVIDFYLNAPLEATLTEDIVANGITFEAGSLVSSMFDNDIEYTIRCAAFASLLSSLWNEDGAEHSGEWYGDYWLNVDAYYMDNNFYSESELDVETAINKFYQFVDGTLTANCISGSFYDKVASFTSTNRDIQTLSSKVIALENAPTDPIFNDWLSAAGVHAGRTSITEGSSIAIGNGAIVSGGGQGVAIGPNVSALGIDSVAIGGVRTIAGGNNGHDQATAVGPFVKSIGYRSVAVGAGAQALSNFSTAIGDFATVSAWKGTAIGHDAKVNHPAQYMPGSPEYPFALPGGIQLGPGTNISAKTLQVYEWQLLDHNGNVPEERLSHLNFMTKDSLDGLFVHLSGDEVLSDRLYLTGSELASKDVKNPYYKKYVFCSSSQLSDPVDVYDVDPWTQFLAMSADSSTTTTIVRNVGPNLSGMELSDIANSYIELTASEVPCEYTHDDYGEQGYLNFHWRWNWKYLDGETGLGTLIIDSHLDSSGRTGSDSISSLSQQELLRKTIGVMFGGESGVQENGEVLIANFDSDRNVFLLNYEGLDTTGTQEEILNEYLTKLPMFTSDERTLGTYQYVKQHERDPFLVSSDVSAFTGELVTGLRDSIERDLESLKDFDYDAPGGEILATLIHNVGVLTTTIKNVSNLLNRYS